MEDVQFYGGKVVFPSMSNANANLHPITLGQTRGRRGPDPREAVGCQRAGQLCWVITWGDPNSANSVLKCLPDNEQALVAPRNARPLPDGKVPHPIVRTELGTSGEGNNGP